MSIIYILPCFLTHLTVRADNKIWERGRDDGRLLLTERYISAHNLHVQGRILLRRIGVVLVNVGDMFGQTKIILSIRSRKIQNSYQQNFKIFFKLVRVQILFCEIICWDKYCPGRLILSRNKWSILFKKRYGSVFWGNPRFLTVNLGHPAIRLGHVKWNIPNK